MRSPSGEYVSDVTDSSWPTTGDRIGSTRLGVQHEHVTARSADCGVSAVRREGNMGPVGAELSLIENRAGVEVDERPACARPTPEASCILEPVNAIAVWLSGPAETRRTGSSSRTGRPTGVKMVGSSMVTRPDSSPIKRRLPPVL